MASKEPLTPEELAEFSKQFPEGAMAPKEIRKELVEYQKEKKLSTAGRKRKELMTTKAGIKQVNKLDLFLEEFVRNGGNATQAAMTVFNCSSREVAANMGSAYLKKSRMLGRLYMEEKGYGYGKMLDIATEKMHQSKNTEWWDRLMKLNGYEDFISTGKGSGSPVSVNVFQAHNALASEYVDGELEEIVEEPLNEH